MSKNTCPECRIRPIGGGPMDGTWNDRQDAREHDMCVVCLAEAYWTNVHSDYAHEILTAEGATTDEMKYDLAECWICNPQLDKSSETYVARNGTSRVGMRMTVPVRAAGADKAAAVKSQLPAGSRVKIEGDTTGTKLTATKGAKDAKITVTATWDVRGRWTGGNVNGKKARNASELLRLAEALSA
jgi:hypothetical protein